jgi:drug/metabolite transporter (DMT)-like permease
VDAALARAPAAWRTTALTAAAMLAFAANSLLCRAALGGGHADPASFTAVRVIGGAAALAGVARWRTSPPTNGRAAWISATALFAYAIGFSLAYTRIPAGVGALLLFAAVQLTMNGAALLAGERPRPLEWLGLVLSLGGLAVLARPGGVRPDPLGAQLMIAAGVSWGVYSLRGRGHGDPVARNAAAFARATPFALAGAAAAVVLGAARLDGAGLALALASGALASGLGYAIWYAALPGLSSSRAAIVQLSAPPLAAVGGVLLLGEAFTARLMMASVLILGGIALAAAAHRR